MVDKLEELQEKLKEMKDTLELRQGELINILAEDDSIYHPEVLLRLIWELRSTRKTINWLNECEKNE